MVTNLPVVPRKPVALRVRQHSNDDTKQAPPLPARPKASPHDPSTPKTIRTERVRRNPPEIPNHLQIPRSKNAIRKVASSGDHVVTICTATIFGYSLASGGSTWNVSITLDSPESVTFINGEQFAVGTKGGNLVIIDAVTGVTMKNVNVGGRPICHLLNQNELLWAVDDSGWVNIWHLQDGLVSADTKLGVARIMEGFKLLHVTTDGYLWAAGGKVLEIHQFDLKDNHHINLIGRFDIEADLGVRISDICGIGSVRGIVITGHEDGHLMLWDAKKATPLGSCHISSTKITAITTFDNYIWVGYSTGKIMIINSEDWQILCEWKAHQTAIIQIEAALKVNSMKVNSMKVNSINLPMLSLCDSANVCAWDAWIREIRIQELVLKEQEQFTEYSNLAIRTCSWNVDAQRPPEVGSFWKEWLDLNHHYDLYIIGIQEMIDLESKSTNAKMIISSNNTNNSSDDSRAQLWVDQITKELQSKHPDVRLISQRNMVGLMMAIFANLKAKQKVRHVSQDVVKTGLGGLHGNKGAIIYRMLIDDTPLCFANCHLAAGQSQSSARNTDLSTIMKSARLPRISPSGGIFLAGDGEQIFDHEHVILLGDLNYRVNLTRDGTIQLINDCKYDELLVHDQLKGQLAKVPFHPLSTFTEFALTFPPTYKYDRGMDTFDSSEKQRVPAYCDRILLRSFSPDTLILSYSSHPSMKISDHRPISASIQVRCKRINWVKRELIKLKVEADWMGSLIE